MTSRMFDIGHSNAHFMRGSSGVRAVVGRLPICTSMDVLRVVASLIMRATRRIRSRPHCVAATPIQSTKFSSVPTRNPCRVVCRQCRSKRRSDSTVTSSTCKITPGCRHRLQRQLGLKSLPRNVCKRRQSTCRHRVGRRVFPIKRINTCMKKRHLSCQT